MADAKKKLESALAAVDEHLQQLCDARKKAIAAGDDDERARLGAEIADLNLKLSTLAHSSPTR